VSSYTPTIRERKVKANEPNSRFKPIVVGLGILLIALVMALVYFKWIRRMIFGDIIFESCAWGGRIQGWLDENENGLWDDNEPAMPEITYVINFDHENTIEVKSNSTGEASFGFYVVCGTEPTTIDIYPLPPSDMQITTDPLLKDISTSERLEDPFVFGFAFIGEE
jgi:hypothetical protein